MACTFVVVVKLDVLGDTQLIDEYAAPHDDCQIAQRG
eukprot:CAMPEP_0185772876 /NCGR_PEP_ID=MMETSP1174-20130828/71468_1 /TAXON_ID=35687 /ORGANISM="Dictyocha speculum, Strain CCMP1381" /LENGTH=36 /DNA_ID= /DNA_START= /DNA_END= /DNA_ORIENTATION=